MAGKAGPYVNNDGLVFHFDTGNTVRSFKGEPAFNAARVLSNWGVYRSTLTATTEVEPPIKGATVYVLERTDINTGVLVREASPSYGGWPNDDLQGLGDGTWKYSIWVKGHPQGDSSTSFQIDIGDKNNTVLSITPTTPWTKVTTTDAAGLNNPSYEFCDFSIGGALNNKIYVSAVMISSGNQSHPQWLPEKATRSATQGLLDLTGNSSIDLTNVSFDSNAQMTFDGTNDTFVISDPGVGTDMTIEVVIKVNNYSNFPIFISPSSVGIDHFFRVQSNGKIAALFVEVADSSTDGYGSTTVLSTTNYYHVVMSKSPSNGTMYVNGVAEDSHTPTLPAAAWSGDWRIGARWNNTYWFNGELPVMKVYNRALTASEVERNFNAVKTRFGI